jgi:hypothetical protein
MVFIETEQPLYLVWKHCLGGDFLVKVYQSLTEANDRIDQIRKTGWNTPPYITWIQTIIIKKEIKQ